MMKKVEETAKISLVQCLRKIYCENEYHAHQSRIKVWAIAYTVLQAILNTLYNMIPNKE